MTGFTLGLDDVVFLLDDIEDHPEFAKLQDNDDDDDFIVMKELLISARDLSLTVLKKLHTKQNRNSTEKKS